MSWEELMSWNHFVKATDSITGLSIEEKKSVKEAHRTLKLILKDKFLDEIRERNHPLLMKISNRIPNARRWVIRFARIIK
ncbi:MAG: hypothetical protein HZR80_14140 [Candidatus Heimdallarchaeota archaeon]